MQHIFDARPKEGESSIFPDSSSLCYGRIWKAVLLQLEKLGEKIITYFFLGIHNNNGV